MKLIKRTTNIKRWQKINIKRYVILWVYYYFFQDSSNLRIEVNTVWVIKYTTFFVPFNFLLCIFGWLRWHPTCVLYKNLALPAYYLCSASFKRNHFIESLPDFQLSGLQFNLFANIKGHCHPPPTIQHITRDVLDENKRELTKSLDHHALYYFSGVNNP